MLTWPAGIAGQNSIYLCTGVNTYDGADGPLPDYYTRDFCHEPT